MDPDYYDGFEDAYDDGFEDGQESVYDTFDQIVDDGWFDEIPHDRDDNMQLDGTEMGMAFALASEMAESDCHYDVDEKTDQENWDKAMRVTPLSSRHETRSNLRPFEQYVHDYIRRGCRHPSE